MADHNPEDGRACTECGGALSEARNALGLESCSGTCNAARRRRLACEMARTIPEVLAQHQRVTSKPGGPCWCGQWPRDDERRDTWMNHVASELAPLIGDALASCPADMSGIHAPDGAGLCLDCDEPCPEPHRPLLASALENGQANVGDACDRGPCWLGKGHNGDCRPGPGRMTTPPALTPDENAATEPPLALQRDVHGATQHNPEKGAALTNAEAVTLMRLWDNPGTLWRHIEQHVNGLLAARLAEVAARAERAEAMHAEAFRVGIAKQDQLAAVEALCQRWEKQIGTGIPPTRQPATDLRAALRTPPAPRQCSECHNADADACSRCIEEAHRG